jgi:hypothetical protein
VVLIPEGMQHHVRIQVTTFAGIDLSDFGTGGVDSVSIIGSLLVSFYH